MQKLCTNSSNHYNYHSSQEKAKILKIPVTHSVPSYNKHNLQYIYEYTFNNTWN